MRVVNVSLLGEFSARNSSGELISVGSRRNQALICYLALSIESGGSLDEATQLFGGERVHEIISDLRYVFRSFPPDVLVTEGNVVRLNPMLVAVDAQRFEMHAARTSLQSIREAADLYTGNLLHSFASGFAALDEWIAEKRLHYWQLAVGLHGRLLAAQVRAGWWEPAVETASRLLSLDPSHEVVHRTLMRLQLEQGRPDSALRRYHECADVLRREFGRAPGIETARLREDIVSALERAPAPREVVRLPADHPTLVLIVEDDAVSSALLEGYLEEAGYAVVTVADGGDALIEIGRRMFDLLILDVNLPTLGGLGLFEIMIRKGIETPAVFITGQVGSDAEVRSLEMGAADFLRKPVRKEVLLPRVRSILQRRERALASQRQAE